MTPYAIMTPGGIADQFTRGLSGVAQAFAQRSQIDRQAKQDALAQLRQEKEDARAAEYLALAQQDRERQAASATAEALRQASRDKIESEQRAIENAAKYGIGGNYVGTDPVSVAGRSYLDKQRFDQKEADRRSAAESMRNFVEMTKATTPKPERVVQVIGEDGKPTYVGISDAPGMTPASGVKTIDPVKEHNVRLADWEAAKRAVEDQASIEAQSKYPDEWTSFGEDKKRSDYQDYVISQWLKANPRPIYGGAAGALDQSGKGGTVAQPPPRLSPEEILNKLSTLKPE